MIEKKQKTLRERILDSPILTGYLLLLIQVVILLSTTILLWVVFGPSFVSQNYYLIFVKNFILTAILWLWFIPLILNMPFGRISFKEYLKIIKLTNLKGIEKGFLVAVGCISIIFACMFCAISLTGSTQIEIANVIPPKLWILFLAISPGLWEELIFRGVILTHLLKKYSVRDAILIDALIFASMHSLNLILVGISYDALLFVGSQIIYTFFAGLFLGYLFIETDSLIPGIIVHYSVDALSPIFVYSKSVSDELIALLNITLAAGAIPSLLSLLLIKLVYAQKKKAYKN